MKRENAAIAVLWLLTLGVAVWAAIKTISLLAQFGPAVIAAAATLLAAILTHTLTDVRQQRMEQQKQKQSNYAELLEIAAKYVRNPSDHRDKLDTAHLYSWVVGSSEVIRATQEFTDNRDDVALRKLLDAMREDIGLSGVPNDVQPKVFPPPQQAESLKKRQE